MITSHWHNGSCCELRVDLAHGPDLFRRLAAAADQFRRLPGVEGALSSYHSIAVYWFKPVKDWDKQEATLHELLTQFVRPNESNHVQSIQSYELPTRYDGPDLKVVAQLNQISEAEVIKRHSGRCYVVAAIGFVPHFAYLWGLDEALKTPRRSSPRKTVPAGSVGIAGEQTGVYPQATPGGWQLIGRTMGAPCREVCSRLKVGDEVRFTAAPVSA